MLDDMPVHSLKNQLASGLVFDMDHIMITNEQIKAARALLGWSQPDLAQAVGVSTLSVARVELGGVTDMRERVVAAFEAEGIEFLTGEDGSVGVWYRRNK